MLQQASPRTCHSCPRQQTAAAQHAILYRFHALGHIATSLLMREHTRGQNDLLAPARPSWLLRGRAMGAAPSLQCARARESDAAMQDTRGKHLGMRLFIVVFAAVGLRSVGHGRLHRSCTPPLGISEPRTDVTRRRGRRRNAQNTPARAAPGRTICRPSRVVRPVAPRQRRAPRQRLRRPTATPR